MKVAEAIVDTLSELGVRDAFGIPGGVILELLYAMRAKEGFSPHLCYHEQDAGFAACGYAQAGGALGVAYATRGPGFTNLITPIADAFCDSIPTLFLTAHAADCPPVGMRILHDQELDTCEIVRSITKFAARIDTQEEFATLFPKALQTALDGRKGPVFLDLSARLLHEDVDASKFNARVNGEEGRPDGSFGELVSALAAARRPVVLIGDGLNGPRTVVDVRKQLAKLPLPILSSRCGHALAGGVENYFGYVGSHGIRTANFILSKADLIVSLGNRLNFPLCSESFAEVFCHAGLIRVEIDEAEFRREIPNSTCIRADAVRALEHLSSHVGELGNHADWMEVCRTLESRLHREDVNAVVESLSRLLSNIPPDAVVVSDVGNCEFFLSRAAVLAGSQNPFLYSKSFGALGCALGKSIGAYYATRKPVVCVVGDQGFQMNVQELQHIATNRLPIAVVVVNNGISGMMRDREMALYGERLHVDQASGYAAPDLNAQAMAYGLRYDDFGCMDERILDFMSSADVLPRVIGLRIDEAIELVPCLSRGSRCQNLWPPLSGDLYGMLNGL